MDRGKGKNKGIKNRVGAMAAILAISAIISACGKTTTDDAVQLTKVMATALKNGDEPILNDALTELEKKLNNILENSDGSEKIEAMYLKYFKDAVYYTAQAGKELEVLQTADKAKSFQTIKDIRVRESGGQDVSEADKTLADILTDEISTSYEKAEQLYRQAREAMNASKLGTMDENNKDLAEAMQWTDDILTIGETEMLRFEGLVQDSIGISKQLGGSLDEALKNIELAIEASQNGDSSEYKEFMKKAQKCIDGTKNEAYKQGDTTTLYQAWYMQALKFTAEDIRDAQQALSGLDGAKETGALTTVKKVQEAIQSGQTISKSSRAGADQFAEHIFRDWTLGTSNVNNAFSSIYMCVDAQEYMGDPYSGMVKNMAQQAVTLNDAFGEYKQEVQEALGLTDDQMKELEDATNHGAYGADTDRYVNAIKDLYETLISEWHDGGYGFEQSLKSFKSQQDDNNWQNAMKNFFNGITFTIGGGESQETGEIAAQEAENLFQELWDKLKNRATQSFDEMKKTVGDIADGWYYKADEAWNNAKKTAAENVENLQEGMQDGSEKALKFMKDADQEAIEQGLW